jgi:hypothetical protein
MSQARCTKNSTYRLLISVNLICKFYVKRILLHSSQHNHIRQRLTELNAAGNLQNIVPQFFALYNVGWPFQIVACMRPSWRQTAHLGGERLGLHFWVLCDTGNAPVRQVWICQGAFRRQANRPDKVTLFLH